MRRCLLFLIRCYQALLSPILGPACRFIPSCSEYCCEGIQKKGIVKGIYLGLKRIFRCHPFHVGGYDPIE